VKTRIVIIGGGPSGLLLSQLLDRRGIDSVVLERKTKDYVLSRIRAGVLERGIVKLMEEAGCADRLHAEGIPHDGTLMSYGDEMFRIDFAELTGTGDGLWPDRGHPRPLQAREKAGGQIMNSRSTMWKSTGPTGDAPHVTCTVGGEARRIDCDFIAGCDGFHGVSRQAIPLSVRTEYEKGLSLRLARDFERDPAGQRGTDLRQFESRLCAVLDAQSATEPLLYPMLPFRQRERLDR
jgi:p-hydroxybenzoate 3-monooxygenase